MHIQTITSSQTIAMNLRHAIHDATPGAERWDYDPQHGRYARPNTPEETARAAGRLNELLSLWRQTDPQGYALWEAAMERDEIDAEPCDFCRGCRPS